MEAAMEIGWAEERDLDAILALRNRTIRATTITFTDVEWREADAVAWLDARRRDGLAALVAREAGACLGFASYGPFRPGPGYRRTVEHTIVLDDRAQGRGAGRTLIERLAAVAGERGFRAMVGAISGENEAGLAFHRRTGFQEVGRLPGVGWKFGRALDLVLMQRDLSPPGRGADADVR